MSEFSACPTINRADTNSVSGSSNLEDFLGSLILDRVSTLRHEDNWIPIDKTIADLINRIDITWLANGIFSRAVILVC